MMIKTQDITKFLNTESFQKVFVLFFYFINESPNRAYNKKLCRSIAN